MRIDVDYNDYQAVWAALMRHPKGMDSPFFLAYSYRMSPKARSRLTRAMRQRVRRNQYPYQLHWLGPAPFVIGYWSVPPEKTEADRLNRALVKDAAEHNVHPEAIRRDR